MKYALLLLASIAYLSGAAQIKMSLDDMAAFQQQAGNWQIVGQVQMNRNTGEKKPESTGKKKKKKKSSDEPAAIVSFEPGTGILVNTGNQAENSNLITTWEHGDIILSFDVMLPEGSNSGIFLQGRYEVQLFDSWGVKVPKFSDIGGIYRNWENDPDKQLKGIPPTSNPAKAPGLWQTMKVNFKAPRFDENGLKIKNAVFESIELNGVVVQRDIEVAMPTGAPIQNNEVAKGPIMLQGDHGQVAFRNFTYTLLEDSEVSISNLTYKTYQGAYSNLANVPLDKPETSGKSTLVDISVVGRDNAYAVLFEGDLNITKEDEYTFYVGFSGGYRLSIDGQVVSEINSGDWASYRNGNIKLSAGSHKIKLLNIKSAPWHSPRLGLFVATNSTSKKALSQYDSYPLTIGVNSRILIDPVNEPRLLRAFVGFEGLETNLSHTIGVGHPAGINYVYNLKTGGIIGTWRGDFVDATPMWHDRGNGSFQPNGAVNWTFSDQPIAKLANQNSAFPAFDSALIQQVGYTLDPQSGLPKFKYSFEGIKIESYTTPDTHAKYFTQNLKFTGGDASVLSLKLAEGSVLKMADGSYAIDDQRYYIKVLSGQVPFKRTVNGKTELVLPLNGSDVQYEIVW